VVGFRCGKVENLGGRMRRMKKRGPNVLYDLNDLLFFLTILHDCCNNLQVLAVPDLRLGKKGKCLRASQISRSFSLECSFNKIKIIFSDHFRKKQNVP